MEENNNQNITKKGKRLNGRGFNFGRILLGLILVLIGGIYFLKTTGLVDIQLNIDIWQLWPLLIVFVGLSMMNLRGWLGILIGVIIAVMIIGALFLAFFYKGNLRGGDPKDPTRKEIAIERGSNASAANVSIKFGAGSINIKGGSTDKMLTGLFESSFSNLDISEQTGAGAQRILLKSTGRVPVFNKAINNLDVVLNESVPMSLFVETGASASNIDLRNVITESLNIHTGASSLDLFLGNKQKESKVEVDAGASSLNIILPKGVGAKLNIDSALVSRAIDGFTKIDSKNWETADYSKAEKKIDIRINTGVSSLDIGWK
jgi:hypothetical protein